MKILFALGSHRIGNGFGRQGARAIYIGGTKENFKMSHVETSGNLHKTVLAINLYNQTLRFINVLDTNDIVRDSFSFGSGESGANYEGCRRSEPTGTRTTCVSEKEASTICELTRLRFSPESSCNCKDCLSIDFL